MLYVKYIGIFRFIKEEPVTNNSDAYAFVCKLAATAHKLANDYSLPIPEWVYDDKYVYSGEYYSAKYKAGDLENNYKAILKEMSPPEFVSRNIFLGSKVLSRV